MLNCKIMPNASAALPDEDYSECGSVQRQLGTLVH